MGLYLPYFPSWLQARGFVGVKMSILVALLPICQLASPVFVGLVADKLALRGRMMTFCATSTAVGLSALALSAFKYDPIPFGLAFLCMLGFALLRSPMIGLADVLAMEVANDYGRMRLWGSLGFMVAALLGGRLIDPAHAYELPLSVAGTLWLLVMVSWLLPKTSKLPPRPALIDAKQLLKQTAYVRLLITMVLVFGGTTAYDLCATLRLKELGASGNYVGAFWAIGTCAEIMLMFWAKRWFSNIGPGKALTLACLAGTIRWLFLSQATSLTLILALQPLHAVTFGLMWVSAIGVLQREVGEKGTATAQGLYATAIATGATLGLSLWGVLYEELGSELVFLGAAVFSAFATIGAARLIRITPPETARTE